MEKDLIVDQNFLSYFIRKFYLGIADASEIGMVNCYSLVFLCDIHNPIICC